MSTLTYSALWSLAILILLLFFGIPRVPHRYRRLVRILGVLEVILLFLLLVVSFGIPFEIM